VPCPGLSATFINPALDYLEARGGTLRLQRRLTKLHTEGERVTALEFSDGLVEVAARDRVILAVPPWVAKELAPRVTAPERFEGIVNGHFRVRSEGQAAQIIGVLNGVVEWIFRFEDRISVTVSGANRLMGEGREDLARRFWADVSLALDLDRDLPPWQIVKEKRATFLATTDQQALRPGPRTPYANLVLAGDWTATGLPATIEGALRSGTRAAGLVQEAFA
jgi:phytoene dehydrogenase-like protein